MDLKKIMGGLSMFWSLWGILLGIFFIWYAFTPYEETVIPANYPMNLPGDNPSTLADTYEGNARNDMAMLSQDIILISDYMNHPEGKNYSETGAVSDAKAEVVCLYEDWDSSWASPPPGYEEFHVNWMSALRHYATACDVLTDEETSYNEMLAGGEALKQAAQTFPR
jgi:hypothetical protein